MLEINANASANTYSVPCLSVFEHREMLHYKYWLNSKGRVCIWDKNILKYVKWNNLGIRNLLLYIFSFLLNDND